MSLPDALRPDVRMEQTETRTPPLSLLLAYAALLPLCAGAAAAWLMPPSTTVLSARLFVGWAGGLLCFFSGVRRGPSFRQSRGPTLGQLAATIWLFTSGMASLLLPWTVPALVLELVAYASIAVIDPAAARRGEAPRYFARLRPVQMAVPIVCTGVVLMRIA